MPGPWWSRPSGLLQQAGRRLSSGRPAKSRPRIKQSAAGGPAGSCADHPSKTTNERAASPVEHDPSRGRLLAGSLLFVAGFSAVSVSFAALFGGWGRLLLDWPSVLTRVAGVVVILMGLSFLRRPAWLWRERRLRHRPLAGLPAHRSSE